MKHLVMPVLVCLFTFAPVSRTDAAAEKWFEIKSPNFTVWSDANDGNTRTLVWQMEQIRNVAKTVWPWMKTDLPKPLVIIAVRDEPALKALAPSYWEQKGGMRPGSVWVSGRDQHYIAIRTDMRSRDDAMVNPHTSAYFIYTSLVLGATFERPMPLWVTRGLAGVISNTLVRQNDVVIGATIPWHLEQLRQQRLRLRDALAMTSQSPEYRRASGVEIFDAMAWGFVHYLMFGDKGVHAPKLNAFISAVDKGQDADAAFAATFGPVDDYERGFVNYVNRSLYSAAKIKVDAGLDRERFPARPMTPAESAALRAGFHAAMNRPNEARALIAEARKVEPNSAPAAVAEALLLDQAGDRENAKQAYVKAIEAGSTNAFAYYRAATLLWGTGADEAVLQRVEGYLSKAVELNATMAYAHAALAEVRAVLQKPQATIVPHMSKAVALDPLSPWHRISAARTLMRLNSPEEARKTAEGAMKLAEDDPAARAEAQRILDRLKGR